MNLYWNNKSKNKKKIFVASGTLCILMAIGCIALYLPKWTQAAQGTTPTGWEDYEMADGGVEGYNLGDWEFNASYGTGDETVSKLSDLVFIGTQDGVPCAAIQTQNQLKAVLSGLKTSYTSSVSDSNISCTRSQKVVFKLLNDLSIDAGLHIQQKEDGSWTSADTVVLPGQTPYLGTYLFEKDTFDGMGHKISIKHTAEINNTQVSIDSRGYYYGCLFARVSDATIQNLNIEVLQTTTPHVSLYDLKDCAGGDEWSNNNDYMFDLTGGIVCGVADHAKFSDIEITRPENEEFVMAICDWIDPLRVIMLAAGGIVGCAQSDVSIERCGVEVSLGTLNECSLNGQTAYTGIKGAMIGLVTGANNSIKASYVKGGTYLDIDFPSGKEVKGSGYLVGGILNTVANVKVTDTIYHMVPPVSYIINPNDWVEAIDVDSMCENTYIEWNPNARAIPTGAPWSATIDMTYQDGIKEFYWNGNYYIDYEKKYLGEKKESLNNTDWKYEEETNLHSLIHPEPKLCDENTVGFGDISFGAVKGDAHEIEISADVINWFKTKEGETNQATKNAKAYLSVTTNGDDPVTSFLSIKDQNGHANATGEKDLELSANVKYADISKNMTIKAAVRLVFNSGEANEYSLWGNVWEHTYTPEDLYISEPIVKTARDGEAFEEFEKTVAYPLGTTQISMERSGREGELAYDMYYFFGERSGLTIGEQDSTTNGTLTIETLLKESHYEGAFMLTKDKLVDSSSNQVYMYVLAYGVKDSVPYYKLYEYDFVVYAKDELLLVSPESGSKVSKEGIVNIRIGNGVAKELPYDKARIFISKTKEKYKTLNNVSGVKLYQEKIGAGTEEDPYYLNADVLLNGEPGENYYIYVEPLVNTQDAPEGAIPYSQRYGIFVQEYNYTIMEQATGLTLSPETITLEQVGNAASIPINEKIYMSSSGSSDIIVYDIEGELINPQIVSDSDVLDMLNTSSLQIVGNNAYYCAVPMVDTSIPEGEVLYIRCNDIWYGIESSGGLRVYQDGMLYYGSEFANQTVYVSTMLFKAGYDHSENLIYKYQIQEQEAVAAPAALLAGGTTIAMDKVLNFYCEQDCVMYYTLNGKEPQVTINESTSNMTPGAGTYQYNQAEGIAITQEAGYSYGDTVTIKIIACPVQDASAKEPVYENDKKSSEIVTFTYTIAQQEQVAAPIAYPETSTDKVTEIVNGDRISLSCTTSSADIYYSINGTIPAIDEKNKYTNTIQVNGEYGSYFTVKAIAHKEGMKDSEVATFLYKIADMEVAGEVTATPDTTTQVIAGDKIILSATSSGADIYYTTDGTTPEVEVKEDGTYTLGKSVVKYNPEQAITVPQGTGYFSIYAIAVKKGMKNSPVAKFIYTYADVVSAPYGNPSSGVVAENTQVILQCAKEDAIIYYEIAYDGKEASNPTTSSAVFSERVPIIINRNTQIKAFAYYNRQSSEIITLNYTLAEKMETPEASIGSGSIVPSGTTVKLPVGEGDVYYTTDGSDPSDSSNTAVNAGSEVVIIGNAGDVIVIRACTKKSGATTSELATFTYQISQYPGGVTTDTPVGSTLDSGTVINLSTDVTGGTIYYTTGSGSPIQAGIAGSTVKLTGEPGANITIKAVAVAPKTTMTGSYAFFDYKLMNQLAAPSASVKSGTKLTKATSVVLKANQGTIYYTIDGTTPGKESYEYTAPIVVSKDMTIQAIAIEEGSRSSEISTFTYKMAQQIGQLKTSVSEGVVESGKNVKLSCDTAEVEIYYTTDGKDPDPDAQEGVYLYDDKEGISIYRSVNIKAVAVKEGMRNSDILSVNYQVNEVPVQMEREREAAEEKEAGLKPSDITKLKEQSVSENGTNQVVLNDIFSDTSVSGLNTSISSNTTLRAKEVTVSKEAEKEVEKQLGEEYKIICNYDFVLYKDGTRVQPDGEVEIKIPIPKGYENADVVIVYINDNNGITVHETLRDQNYAYAKVNHFSSYAIVGAQLSENSRMEWDLILVMSAVAGVCVLLGIEMIIRIRRKRKRYE